MSLGYQEIHNAIFRSSSVEKTDKFRIFIEKLKPKVIIEVGTYKGLSAAVLASIAKRVYTFDVIYQPVTIEIWKILNVYEKIEYNIISNISEIKSYLENIEFDFAFMDAEHHRYKFLRELFDLLSKAGIKKILVDGATIRFSDTLRLANEENMERVNQDQVYWEKQ